MSNAPATSRVCLIVPSLGGTTPIVSTTKTFTSPVMHVSDAARENPKQRMTWKQCTLNSVSMVLLQLTCPCDWLAARAHRARVVWKCCTRESGAQSATTDLMTKKLRLFVGALDTSECALHCCLQTLAKHRRTFFWNFRKLVLQLMDKQIVKCEPQSSKLEFDLKHVTMIRKRVSARKRNDIEIHKISRFSTTYARYMFTDFGSGSGQIWLESLKCEGSEVSLSDCQHEGWGQHNCGHSEDVSVSCVSDTGKRFNIGRNLE